MNGIQWHHQLSLKPNQSTCRSIGPRNRPRPGSGGRGRLHQQALVVVLLLVLLGLTVTVGPTVKELVIRISLDIQRI
jgi:hypothetical protein